MSYLSVPGFVTSLLKETTASTLSALQINTDICRNREGFLHYDHLVHSGKQPLNEEELNFIRERLRPLEDVPSIEWSREVVIANTDPVGLLAHSRAIINMVFKLKRCALFFFSGPTKNGARRVTQVNQQNLEKCSHFIDANSHTQALIDAQKSKTKTTEQSQREIATWKNYTMKHFRNLIPSFRVRDASSEVMAYRVTVNCSAPHSRKTEKTKASQNPDKNAFPPWIPKRLVQKLTVDSVTVGELCSKEKAIGVAERITFFDNRIPGSPQINIPKEVLLPVQQRISRWDPKETSLLDRYERTYYALRSNGQERVLVQVSLLLRRCVLVLLEEQSREPRTVTKRMNLFPVEYAVDGKFCSELVQVNNEEYNVESGKALVLRILREQIRNAPSPVNISRNPKTKKTQEREILSRQFFGGAIVFRVDTNCKEEPIKLPKHKKEL